MRILQGSLYGCTAALLLFSAARAEARQGAGAEAAAPTLDALLEELRAEHDLPALAGAVVRGGELVELGAVGRRRADREEAVTTDDLWHLGSCTKSMTATWIALCVERGELEWTTTVGEAFAELREAGRMDPAWADVPIEWLLQNRGGAPNDLDADGLWGRLWAHQGTPAEQRRALVEGVLARPPDYEPGTRYVYSNAGFAIAAAMVEAGGRAEWEERIRRELFEPLGAKSFGFGAPGSPDALDQPRGHRERDGEARAIEPGPRADNPSAIAPAGKAHATLADWAKYAALHLGHRPDAFEGLGDATLARLHEPALDRYAMGWVDRGYNWAEGRALWHNGSNTMWYCELALFPDEDLAVLVATNRGDGRAREGVGAALRALYERAMAAAGGR